MFVQDTFPYSTRIEKWKYSENVDEGRAYLLGSIVDAK